MPSFINSDPYVQVEYTNFHGAGFPGQFFRATDAWNRELQSFAVDTDAFIFCGRLVVQAVAQTDDGSLPLLKPFSVKPVVGDEIDASTFAGIVYRPFSGALNDSSEDNERKAGFAEKMVSSIVPFGKGIQLHVRQAPGLSVAFGDDVYVAIADIAGPPQLFPGEFTNAAGVNLIQVPNARWYVSKDATDVDQDGVIEFN
jgi:hypothetical protein